MGVVLSKRLQALADMVTPGNRVADVGCDHGFLSVYLVLNGISPRCLAMDVREGPLFRAKEHILEYELDNYIDTRLSDGLSAYRIGEADAMVCAGMGGRMMTKILAQDAEKAHSLSELILQPQSELPAFRSFLYREGYEILDENILCEEGKFYFLMKIAWKGECPKEGSCREDRTLFDAFGEKLLTDRHPVLKEYLIQRTDTASKIKEALLQQRKERARERLSEVERELFMLREAMNLFK